MNGVQHITDYADIGCRYLDAVMEQLWGHKPPHSARRARDRTTDGRRRSLGGSRYGIGGAHRGLSGAAADATDAADDWERNGAGALLAVQPDLAPASSPTELMRRSGTTGFVVEDMTDVDLFAPIEAAVPSAGPLYFLHDLDRGDHMANWSPDEALPAITSAERTPLLLTEGDLWLLRQPAALQRNHCFMTIGSRLRTRRGGQDPRNPGDLAQQRRRPRRGRATQRT